MFVKRYKSIYLALLVLFLLIIIPASFAEDNGTEMLSQEVTNETQVVSVPLDDEVLSAGEIYFDASAETDGDGSFDSPYKYLRAYRIQGNCNLHLANGEYQLDTYKYVEQVNIIGSDVDKTIIKYDGVAFKVNNQLTVKNITFIGASINNFAKFNATNTVFEDGSGSNPDSYGNNYGGAICTDAGCPDAYVNVDNCTFKNNYAVYGGAIFIGSGNLNVYNSLFFNNYAYNYGGAIACEYMGNVNISKSKFYNSRSLTDAGGSIYIKSSKFNADHVDIINSSSTFGGAITTLNTSVVLSHVNMANNSAKYDGGAIFHMYGNFSLVYSTFDNNSASNGGAVFIDNSTNAIFMFNTFTNNKATNTGGAVYSILNKLNAPFQRFNSANFNIAANNNDYFDISSLNLTIGSGNYTMYKVNITPIDSLPSRYSLVEAGYSTSIKDQQTSGNCWAFTAIAVLESCILKANGDLLDLSEENMKNIIALYSDYGWNKLDTNDGGYDNMPWGYLAGWLGPVNEMDDLFDDRSTLSALLNSIMHVQNIKFLQRSSYTDNDEIKRAILNYGAVGTSIYQDSRYLNSNTNAFYCWYYSSCNHAVTIVGWDDNFSKDNFRWGSEVGGDGAWIVKNSWGSSWGDNGYYYVSYYDKNFARPGDENCAYTIVLNDTIRFDKNYQYDIAGMTDFFLNSSSQVWYKNIFTASSDEYLAAVSTYFEKACNWTASVLVNGELKEVLSGTTDAGYYTLNLNRYIPLKSGDVFEVIFNVTMDGGASFPISEIFSLNKLIYGPQTSFVSYDGENWKDLYNLTWAYSTHTYRSQVACIKAFTYLNPINTFTDLIIGLNEDNLLNISAIVSDVFGNIVKYGNVTFSINGESQSAGVTDGISTILYDFKERINAISVSFDGQGYNSSSNSTVYTVPKVNVTLQLNIIKNYNNVDIEVTASKSINETVKIHINGNETLLNLIDGANTLSLKNLSNDNYDVFVELLNDTDFEADVAYGFFVINLLKTTIISTNLTASDDEDIIYNVTLIDENKEALADMEIVFNLNNVSYINKTDENGQAIFVVKLDKGVYDINVSFEGDNDHFKSDAMNTIKVKGKVFINLDVNAFRDNAFIYVYADNGINETFRVLINDKPYNITSKNGFASLKLYNLSNNFYNVSVSLDENEYEFNEASSHFVIDVEDLVEITTNITISGDDVIVGIAAGNAEGDVIVMVDGEYESVKLNNGSANYTIRNIAPGNHTIVVMYDNSVSPLKYEVINIPKKESNINLSVENAKVGEKSTISVEVAHDATGLVSVDINGTSYLINLSKTNVLDVVLDKAGQYPIVATYLGDDRYQESKSDQKVLVVSDKLPANIKVEMPDDINVGDEITINITSDSDAELVVVINGNIQEFISADKPLGVSSMNVLTAIQGNVVYKVLHSGTYNVTVSAEENSEYASESVTILFEVAKKDAILNIVPINDVKVGNNVTINVDSDTDGELTVKVNGEAVVGEYEITKPGSYTVVVESAATDAYNKGFATYTFEVAEPETNITVIVDGEEYTIPPVNGTVINTTMPEQLAEANEKIDNLTKELNETQAKVDNLTDELANATDKIADLTDELTEAQANATKLADELADANKTIGDLTDELVDAQANATKLAEDLADANKAIEDLTDELADAKDNITDLSAQLEEAQANATKLADELANATEKIADLTDELVDAQVNATKLADELANATDKIADLTDELVDAQVNATKLADDLADANKTIEDLTRQLEEALANQTKTVVVDGKEYPIEYVNGTATVTTDPDNNITVVVDGKEYPAEVINGTATITIEPAKQIGTVIESEYKFTRQANDWDAGERGDLFYAVLKDINGNPLANMPCLVAVNGPIYNVTTDDQGRFGVQINLARANTYTYALSFLGNDKYSASFNSTKLILTAKKTSITAKAKTFNAKAKTKSFTVTLKTVKNPYDGKAYLSAGKKITLKVNGKTYTAKTNAKGVAKFTIKLTKKGKYAAKVTFAGDKTYKASSKKVILTIK